MFRPGDIATVVTGIGGPRRVRVLDVLPNSDVVIAPVDSFEFPISSTSLTASATTYTLPAPSPAADVFTFEALRQGRASAEMLTPFPRVELPPLRPRNRAERRAAARGRSHA
jgi:hypothetical protein